MQLLDLYYHHFSRFLHSDLWQFELSILLHTIARSLITIFVPILLIQIGFSISEVLIYLTIYCAIDVPLNFFAKRVTARFGARKTIVFGTLAAIAYFVLLFFLDTPSWTLLIALAAMSALYDTLYWVSHIYLFIESNKAKGKVTERTGLLYAIRRFGALLGPVVGAGILIFASRDALILASIVMFALSIVPLFRMHHTRDRPKKTVPFRRFFKSFRERNDYASMALFSVHRGVEFWLWPLFIFTVFGSIESVAVVPVVVSLTTMIFSYFSGRIARRERAHMIMLGAMLLASVWAMRYFFSDETAILYVSIFLIGLFSLLVSVPLEGGLFERARDLDALSAATYRNVVAMAARGVLVGILAFAVTVFHASFLAAMVALFLLFLANFLFFTLWGKRA